MNKSTKEIRLPKQQLSLEPKPKLNSSSKTIAKPNVSGSPSFKEQLLNDFIPRIEEMAKKEKEHLHWLVDHDAPIDFIQLSQKYYSHFVQRIKEYYDYANGL